jgi:hypothetical protein
MCVCVCAKQRRWASHAPGARQGEREHAGQEERGGGGGTPPSLFFPRRSLLSPLRAPLWSSSFFAAARAANEMNRVWGLCGQVVAPFFGGGVLFCCKNGGQGVECTGFKEAGRKMHFLKKSGDARALPSRPSPKTARRRRPFFVPVLRPQRGGAKGKERMGRGEEERERRREGRAGDRATRAMAVGARSARGGAKLPRLFWFPRERENKRTAKKQRLRVRVCCGKGWGVGCFASRLFSRASCTRRRKSETVNGDGRGWAGVPSAFFVFPFLVRHRRFFLSLREGGREGRAVWGV